MEQTDLVYPFQFAEGATAFITPQIDYDIIQDIVDKCKYPDVCYQTYRPSSQLERAE